MTRHALRFRFGAHRRERASEGAIVAGVAGIALGATATALLDPRSGARRRGQVAQKAIHARKLAGEFGGKAARDLANRSRGLVASLRWWLRPEEPSPDVLVERVRACLGRLTSHPSAVEVRAQDGGIVDLSGPILEVEADRVLEGVARVHGVQGVMDHLARHGAPGRVQALQGAAARPPLTPELLQRSWTPGIRALVLACGASLSAWGLKRRSASGAALAGAGVLLAARAIGNVEWKRLLGVRAGRRAVDLRKTITIGAPREEVFAFFRAFENFPRFMSHVREVRRTQDGRWHWKVDGPAGTTVEWDAEVSAYTPGAAIAWKTLPGASVESSGIVRFEDAGEATRLDVRLSYNPPAGALGHAAAALLGDDPQRQMDDDLLRLKSLLETGKAEGVTRSEIEPQQPLQE